MLQRLASPEAVLGWLASRGVRGLSVDSRRLAAGDAFIAWPGHAVDGRGYVSQALAAGAAACLVEEDGAERFGLAGDDRIAAVSGLKAATGRIASDFMGRPSERLDVVACTGTNGKTSTAWWTAQALSALGRPAGVVGTLGSGLPPALGAEAAGDAGTDGGTAASTAAGTPAGASEKAAAFGTVESTGLTTPDPVTLQRAFRGFVDAGLRACAIEASSHGIAEERLAGTRIAVAQFTNLTQDHLDYHGTMAAYWEAKARLFAWPGLRAAVVNIDDAHGAPLARDLARDGAHDVWTCSLDGPARLRAHDLRHDGGTLAFEVEEAGRRETLATALVGRYNVANLLLVIGALRALGVPLADAAAVCARLQPVPGRMQRVRIGGDDARDDLPQVVVDYAHTPDALDKALTALQPFAHARGGVLWAVFGCGGNRDAAKRALMGGVAARLAGRVVVTSDNPRHEPPEAILAQIVAGIADAAVSPEVIENRAEAIAHAVRSAGPRDVVLVAGKGHEDTQEIAGVKQPFSDVAVAGAALARRAAGAAA